MVCHSRRDRGIKGDCYYMKFPYSTIILASQSIARKTLLESYGLHVTTEPTNCDETHTFVDFKEAIKEIALRKLDAYIKNHTFFSDPVITADTMVKIGSTLFGKPTDREDAFHQLEKLSGVTHSVISGYALFIPSLGRIYCGVDETFVTFHPLSKATINDYLDTQEYIGAAASYRIQEKGKTLISSIEGDFTTVVGLPMITISAILSEPENFIYQEYPPKGEN